MSFMANQGARGTPPQRPTTVIPATTPIGQQSPHTYIPVKFASVSNPRHTVTLNFASEGSGIAFPEAGHPPGLGCVCALVLANAAPSPCQVEQRRSLAGSSVATVTLPAVSQPLRRGQQLQLAGAFSWAYCSGWALRRSHAIHTCTRWSGVIDAECSSSTLCTGGRNTRDLHRHLVMAGTAGLRRGKFKASPCPGLGGEGVDIGLAGRAFAIPGGTSALLLRHAVAGEQARLRKTLSTGCRSRWWPACASPRVLLALELNDQLTMPIRLTLYCAARSASAFIAAAV